MVVQDDLSSPDSTASSQRFGFGENWRAFLSVLDDERIAEAEKSLRDMLGVRSLAGRTFLDVGSGSGLFSLAAMRLGAEQVYSFDYDPQSVACTAELKRRYFPDDERWTVERGDILKDEYVNRLEPADIVYSWGVLHHTGNMWRALANITRLVRPEGILFISIYNDQGRTSRLWTLVKRLYNAHPNGKRVVAGVFIPYFAFRTLVSDLVRFRNPTRSYREYKRSRGMSRVHDWHDWLGGYPFEVAKPEEIFNHYKKQGFALERLKTCGGGLGCNEFVLRRS